MSSAQQQEYFRKRAEEEQRRHQPTVQRRKQATPEENAQRWRAWAKYGALTAGVLVVLTYSWIYLWPMISQRVFVPAPLEEVTIEDLVTEYNDDPAAADKKYAKKRLSVSGKLAIEQTKKGAPAAARAGRIYFEIPGQTGEESRVYCEFFDQDDAESISPGEEVRVSGVVERAGPKSIKLVGASRD